MKHYNQPDAHNNEDIQVTNSSNFIFSYDKNSAKMNIEKTKIFSELEKDFAILLSRIDNFLNQ